MPDVWSLSDTSIATFGELLRYLRQRAGLTQQEFGQAVGYSHAQIARLEGGKRLPDVTAVQSLFVEALGLHSGSEMAARLIGLAAAAREDAFVKAAGEELHSQAPNNLPIQATSFIGRERELGELRHMLGSTRLLTMTGSGGTGKTRLALQLAADVAEDYPAGVWLVELATVSDPAFVPRAIAAVLGVREEPGCPLLTTLLEDLRARNNPLLLLLDNCEHLIDACAHFAEGVLRGGESARILATSREGLGIPGELNWPVPSLQTPAAGETLELVELARYESVRLFVERARFTLPAFGLTATNATAVRQICYRLDGIPLAIELAAALVKSLPPEKIVERLNNRFRLLTGGSRTALPRQQTLRGTIDWSYNLLTETERTLLRRLSVFMGGWTLEQCEAICTDAPGNAGIASSDVLGVLMRLVDKSLVIAQAGESGDIIRYHLLETIRQYAREHLADTDEGASMRDRHLDYFTSVGRDVRLQRRGDVRSYQASLVKRLELDLDNVRSALEWAIEAERFDEALQLADGFYWVWINLARQSELLEWYQRLLAQLPAEEKTSAHARVLLQIAGLQDRESELLDQAAAAVEQSLAISIALDDPETQVFAYQQSAYINIDRGRTAQARADIEQCQAVMTARNLFDQKMRALMLSDLRGWLALYEDDCKTAETAWKQVYEIYAKAGDKLHSSAHARLIGYALLYQGEVAQASAWFRESLVDNISFGDRQAVSSCLAAFAMLALARRELRQAARLFGVSEAVCESIHTPLQSLDLFQVKRNLGLLHAQLDENTLKTAWAEGRVMNMAQAIDVALAMAT